MVHNPILVGELNPYGGRPEHALFCHPPNSAGGRLQRLIFAIPRWKYLECPRFNLCVGEWSAPAARVEARALLTLAKGRTLVLLGKKVCDAFQVPFDPFQLDESPSGQKYVILPHPSGRNRMWEADGAIERAQELLRAEFPHLGIGDRLQVPPAP